MPIARTLSASLLLFALTACSAASLPSAPTTPRVPDETAVTHHRRVTVDGVEIFYREAGRPDAPAVVLLHGFPASSHMFRNLIPALADRVHLIAPDYPAFGESAVPDRKAFAYTFEHLAQIVDALLAKLGVDRYALYVQDYGAPVGYRLALRHPERVTALVVQNGNAYEEGLREFWTPLKAAWSDPSKEHREALRAGLTLLATKSQYLGGVSDPSRIAPESWVYDQALLDRPGVDEIMLDLFEDYRTNVALYPRFQEFFRTRRPPTLIVWGKNDIIFPEQGAHPYKRDIPDAELHLLDTGHFALEDKGGEIAALMRDFFDRNSRSPKVLGASMQGARDVGDVSAPGRGLQAQVGPCRECLHR